MPALAKIEGPVAFLSSNWYLGPSTCDAVCAEVKLACDGAALKAYSSNVKAGFEGFVEGFASVEADYCDEGFSILPQSSSPSIGDPSGTFKGHCSAGYSSKALESSACEAAPRSGYLRLCPCTTPSTPPPLPSPPPPSSPPPPPSPPRLLLETAVVTQVTAQLTASGELTDWTAYTRLVFEAAAGRVLYAYVNVTGVEPGSVVVSFTASKFENSYTDERSLWHRLGDAETIAELKDAIAADTGFNVTSGPQVLSVSVLDDLNSKTPESSLREVYSRRGSIVGGVLGSVFGVCAPVALAFVARRYNGKGALKNLAFCASCPLLKAWPWSRGQAIVPQNAPAPESASAPEA